MESSQKGIFYAVSAALFYGLNMPFSKLLLAHIQSTILAGLLFLSAGIGIGILYLFRRSSIPANEHLGKEDLFSTLAMIALDIIASILLLAGLRHTSAANASLLSNFEIAATSLIAWLVFKESISAKLWAGIISVTLSSFILSFENMESFQFSFSSLLVLAAACCWGLENHFTGKLSSKSTYDIVMVKGICCTMGSLIIGLCLHESLPPFIYGVGPHCWGLLHTA